MKRAAAVLVCVLATAVGMTAASALTSSSPAARSLTVVSASTSARLYPGSTGDLLLKVSNPNAFPVTITDVVGSGAITSNAGASCNIATGVTIASQHGLSRVVAAHARSAIVTLPGAVAMSNRSADACQGATFTVPVTATAAS